MPSSHCFKNTITALVVGVASTLATAAAATDVLPISDVHTHYSHDSVELTPPERVIELMRSANLKFAMVSSSDDKGTQLLSELAPDLIVPSLRPYRQRGETSTWFKDPEALEYTEKLLATNRYAAIGEFHIFASDAELPIPKRIAELAAEHNLILHVHGDARAVETMLGYDPTLKVIWAHSGFNIPEIVMNMLNEHDRLWTDLAFREDVASGGKVDADWLEIFTKHPDRVMLGSDTYTPERMYYLPEHAENSRGWLNSLPAELAENIAWKNAYNLIMPHWQANRSAASGTAQAVSVASADKTCTAGAGDNIHTISESPLIMLAPSQPISVSEQFSANITICANDLADATIELNAIMPAHGHGMNYKPEYKVLEQSDQILAVQVDGLLLHMPGNWQWMVELQAGGDSKQFKLDFNL